MKIKKENLDIIEELKNSSKLLESYCNQVISILSIRFKDDEELLNKSIELLASKINENFCDPEEFFINDYKTVLDEDGSLIPTKGKIKLNTYVDKYKGKTKPLVSGYGLLLKQETKSKESNETLKMIETLIKMRKIAKKEMFEAMNKANECKLNGDNEGYLHWSLVEKSKNLQQLIYKLLANSVYGAMGESNSIFFNHNIAASVTFTGVQLITTAIMAFEGFLQNNVPFKDLDDMYLFITNVVNEDYSYEISDVISNHISKEKLKKYLASKFFNTNISKFYLDEIDNIVETLDQDNIDKIYYKRNLIEFLENDVILELLGTILDYKFENFSDIPEAVSEDVQTLIELCDDFVAYYYAYIDRYDRCLNDTRKAVIVVDTDSNFISLKNLVDLIYDNYDLEKSQEQEISIINLLIYLLSHYIARTFDIFTEKLNVPEERKEIIDMKSEFLYSRVMLTKNKKQYSGKLIAREGNMIPGGKNDTKGLAIKKVTVNNYIRDYFMDIIENDILDNEEIKLAHIINKFNDLKNIIKNSLLNGEPTFAIPSSVNSLESYELPYSQPSVRGMVLWNNIYPSDSIQSGNSILLLKIKVETLQDLAPLYECDEDSEEYAIYNIIKSTIDTINTNATKMDTKRKSPIVNSKSPLGYGFKVMALPRNIEKIPEWLIQFIDIDKMIDANISNGLIIAKSLGIKTPEIKGTEYLSNIIQF